METRRRQSRININIRLLEIDSKTKKNTKGIAKKGKYNNNYRNLVVINSTLRCKTNNNEEKTSLFCENSHL